MYTHLTYLLSRHCHQRTVDNLKSTLAAGNTVRLGVGSTRFVELDLDESPVVDTGLELKRKLANNTAASHNNVPIYRNQGEPLAAAVVWLAVVGFTLIDESGIKKKKNFENGQTCCQIFEIKSMEYYYFS